MLKFKSVRTKLFFGCIVLSIIPMALITTILYNASSQAIKQNTAEALLVGVNGYAEKIDNLFLDLYYATIKVTFNDDLRKDIKEDDERAIKEYLTNLEKSMFSVDSVSLHLIEGKKTISSDRETIKEDYHQMGDIYGEIKSSYPIDVIDHYDPIRKKYLLSIKKDIYDRQSNQIIGSIMVNVDERTVYYDILNGMTTSNKGSIYMINEDKFLISVKNQGQIGTFISDEKELDFLTTSKGYKTIKNKGEKIVTIYAVSKITKYKVVYEKPEKQVVKDITKIKYISFLLIIIVFLLIIVLWYFYTNDIYHPIKQIKDEMDKMGEGKFKRHLVHTRTDELGTLIDGFNNMSERVHYLFNEVYHTKYQKKEAELRALQSQITPHFLYNTLNSIKCVAVLNKNKVISTMLSALIDLLRATAGNKNTFIPLSREIEQADNYIKLQQFRYNNAFDVVYEIDEEFEEVMVPKLIIQPLIENSILHGLELRGNKGLIKIVASKEDNKLILEVIDNGRGISKEQIEKIFNNTEDKSKKFSGIGVFNVDERIKLYYGREYGLSYISHESVGTIAKITVPIQKNGGEKDEDIDRRR